jgi:hypothetical protein
MSTDPRDSRASSSSHTHGQLPPKVERSSALPSADLLQFIHTLLGERAVRQGKSHKAAPDVFRRFQDEH